MVVQCCPLNSVKVVQQPHRVGRGHVLNEGQEREICNMLMTNNAITMRQIHAAKLEDNAMFLNVTFISILTIYQVLRKASVEQQTTLQSAL